MRDLVSTLILLGALQGAALALILWRRNANRLANRIMATLVALVAIMLLAGELERRWGASHPDVLGLSAPLPFLFGPLLYLFVIALTRPVTRPDPRWLAHALPFLGDLLYLAQVFYFEPPAAKLALARASASGQVPVSFHVVSALGVVQALTYIALAWGALARYERKIHGYFSDLTHIDLRWLRILVAAHAAVWSVVLVTTVLRWLGTTPSPVLPVVQVASALAIFLTGYVSLWQSDLATRATAAQAAELPVASTAERWAADGEPPPEVSPSDPATPDACLSERAAPEPGSMDTRAPVPLVLVRAPRDTAAPTPPRYERNRLDDGEAQELLARLEEFMRVRRAYLDTNLTLSTLADALAITPHMLSQLLNVWVGKSFFAYVNGRRADALMAALADPRNAQRGVLDLGLEVGFSSKSTLNSFFRKHTGTTPTEFRARALAQKSAGKSHG